MEVKVPKEIRDYQESIFFGLSTRQLSPQHPPVPAQAFYAISFPSLVRMPQHNRSRFFVGINGHDVGLVPFKQYYTVKIKEECQ